MEERPVAPAAAELFQDTDGNQARDDIVRRLIAKTGDFPNIGNPYDRPLVQDLQHAVAVACGAPEVGSDSGAVRHSHVEDLARIAHQSLFIGMNSVIYVNDSLHLYTQKSPSPWRHIAQHDSWSLKASLGVGLWPVSTAAA